MWGNIFEIFPHMADRISTKPKVEEEFSLPLFLFVVTVSFAAVLGLVWWLAPHTVWVAQVGGSWWMLLGTFLAVSMFNCFMEFFFHRYVLHKPVLPFLSYFYRQHTHHHSLTRITRRRTPGGMEVNFVENFYPIVEQEQKEASFFPWYTFLIFAACLTPMFALLQWVMPSLPWFLGGYAALAASLMLYEIFHAIEHWSFEKWGPLIDHPRWGGFWRKIYSFHLRHHAVIDCNEAISGFFILPVADWVFGTCIIPGVLYKHGQTVAEEKEFLSPRPVGLIRWLDHLTDQMVKTRRQRAAHGV
jgi:hemolysin III